MSELQGLNETYEYLPILALGVIVIVIACVLPVLSALLGTQRPSERKLQTYECGIAPEQEAAGPYSIKFGVTAMLFLLFDIELMFFYPWAASYGKLGLFGLFAMLVFLFVLAVGFLYEFKVGAFDWETATDEAQGAAAGEARHA